MIPDARYIRRFQWRVPLPRLPRSESRRVTTGYSDPQGFRVIRLHRRAQQPCRRVRRVAIERATTCRALRRKCAVPAFVPVRPEVYLESEIRRVARVELRQGEAGATGLAGRPSVLHQALRLLRGSGGAESRPSRTSPRKRTLDPEDGQSELEHQIVACGDIRGRRDSILEGAHVPRPRQHRWRCRAGGVMAWGRGRRREGAGARGR